jgi:hypothetical protein
VECPQLPTNPFARLAAVIAEELRVDTNRCLSDADVNQRRKRFGGKASLPKPKPRGGCRQKLHAALADLQPL